MAELISISVDRNCPVCLSKIKNVSHLLQENSRLKRMVENMKGWLENIPEDWRKNGEQAVENGEQGDLHQNLKDPGELNEQDTSEYLDDPGAVMNQGLSELENDPGEQMEQELEQELEQDPLRLMVELEEPYNVMEPVIPRVDAGSFMTVKEDVVSHSFSSSREEQPILLKGEVVVDSYSTKQELPDNKGQDGGLEEEGSERTQDTINGRNIVDESGDESPSCKKDKRQRICSVDCSVCSRPRCGICVACVKKHSRRCIQRVCATLTNMQKVQCQTCQRIFPGMKSLNRHHKDVVCQPGESKYTRKSKKENPFITISFKCSTCDKIKTTETGIKNHVNSEHHDLATYNKKFICKVCGHELNTHSGALRHVNKHKK